jgi:hypothetical protein
MICDVSSISHDALISGRLPKSISRNASEKCYIALAVHFGTVRNQVFAAYSCPFEFRDCARITFRRFSMLLRVKATIGLAAAGGGLVLGRAVLSLCECLDQRRGRTLFACANTPLPPSL